MSKHNLGIFYFKKALQENDNVCAQLSAGSTDPGEPADGSQFVFHCSRKAWFQRASIWLKCTAWSLHTHDPTPEIDSGVLVDIATLCSKVLGRIIKKV